MKNKVYLHIKNLKMNKKSKKLDYIKVVLFFIKSKINLLVINKNFFKNIKYI